VTDDAGRAQVEAFFAEHIPDPTRLPVTADFRRGRDGADDLVIAVTDERGIVGAAFSGPPWMEADSAVLYGGDETLVNAMCHGSWMLHDMAVRQDARRRGLGTGRLSRRSRVCVAGQGSDSTLMTPRGYS
jgi:GNAT superfamily N-acetyltransferase